MNSNPETRDQLRYASIMVPLTLGVGAEDRVKLAGSLAEKFGSRVIGIAAEDIVVPYFGDGAAVADPILIEQAKRIASENLAKAETIFLKAIGNPIALDWRSAIEPARNFVLQQSRAADLLVVARQGTQDRDLGSMALSAGDLVMDLGRPLIVVPPGVTELSGKHVVIAWKDTREARRAVWDAMPLLTRASSVAVLSVGADAEEQGAQDVSAYLSLHGVSSRAVTRPNTVRFAIDEIVDFVHQEGADLIVSGAYGHSRMREWMCGGVTHDLLEGTPVCCLMSH